MRLNILVFEGTVVDKTVEHLTIADSTCNDYSYNEITIAKLNLITITIGSHCFNCTNKFIIKRCKLLTHLSVGKNSFSADYGTFEVKQCQALEGIEVGDYSLREFAVTISSK